MNARILVLLAAYNGADRIGSQIRSILAQTGVDVRLMIRDDCSSDSTAAAVLGFASREPRVQVTVAEQPSGSAAQNFFSLIRECAASEYDYVALSDQDDEWCSDKLLQAAQALATGGRAGYSSSVTAVWPDGTSNVLGQCPVTTPSDFLFEGAGQGCTFVLTQSFYSRVRSFLLEHEPLSRDLHYHDWCIYALARSWNLPWEFNPRPTMRYLQHDSNDTGARTSVKGIMRRLEQIRQGWYRSQLLAISSLCFAAGAASNTDIAYWHQLLRRPRTIGRRFLTAGFVLAGGRRRISDRTLLVVSAFAGWI